MNSLARNGALSTRLVAACGVAGPIALVAYFAAPAFLAWPYSGAPSGVLVTYATAHESLFYGGAWLQSTGTLLSVVFFLALMLRGGAGGRLSGQVLMVSCAALLSVVLIESALLVAVPMAAVAGDRATVATTFALSNGAFIRIFPLAPSSVTYIALGLVILGSGVLHRRFGQAALAIGVVFEVAGAVAIFTSSAPIVIAVLAAGQALWVIAAAVAVWRSA